MNIIYVASPYAGDVEQNVKNAREYCRYTMEQGNIPLASHLLYPQILNDLNPAERSIGTQMGLELLARCDELWAFGDPSPGMMAEIAEAERLGIPVRQITLEELEENRLAGKYGIMLDRSASVFQCPFTAWVGKKDELMVFDSYSDAAKEAHRLNKLEQNPEVTYSPKQMPEWGESPAMRL